MNNQEQDKPMFDNYQYNVDEQYIDLLADIIENGNDRGDRTGTGTRSTFAQVIRHDMSTGFPLVTTKKMATKQMVYENHSFTSSLFYSSPKRINNHHKEYFTLPPPLQVGPRSREQSIS